MKRKTLDHKTPQTSYHHSPTHLSYQQQAAGIGLENDCTIFLLLFLDIIERDTILVGANGKKEKSSNILGGIREVV